MKSKALRIVLDIILSVIVLFGLAVLASIVSGAILGTHKVADGTEKVNGGMATSTTIFIIIGALTIAFAIWFYKFLCNFKVTKVSKVEE